MSPVDKRKRWKILTLVIVVIITSFCVQQYRSHKEHDLCNALCEEFVDNSEDKEFCFSLTPDDSQNTILQTIIIRITYCWNNYNNDFI